MKVKVGETCLTCKFWGSYTHSCSYLLIEKHSRIWDKNGNKSDPEYCDKYIEGKPTMDKAMWAKEGRVKIK